MLYRMKTLLGHHIHASDGLIGKLDDFYFDDSQWFMRYLIVDIGKFLVKRKVLISPVAMVSIDVSTETVLLQHSMDEIGKSPDIDLDKPVYRQLEEQLFNYYAWAPHWIHQVDLPELQTNPVATEDTHLRSMNNVCKYTVMAFDGRVGSITDFILDDNGWRIPLAVLDTSHYLSISQVIIPASHLKGIRVEDHEISIDMKKEEVAASPSFDPARPLEEYL